MQLKKKPTLRLMKSEQKEKAVYSLLRVCYRDATRYVFYVGGDADGAFEVFRGTEKEAKALYGAITQGNLATEHLSDVIHDARQMAEFF